MAVRGGLRGVLLAAVLAVTAASAFAGQEAVSRNRFNVLFIAVDDLRAELDYAGARHAATVHLDRLASQGVLFHQHFVQVPTCGASRYSMLTGRSPASSGGMGNGAAYSGRSALKVGGTDGAQTLPELFRRSGYRTVCIGKISHTPDGRVFAYDGSGDGRPELPEAWDELATPFGAWQRGWGAFFAYADGRHREDGEGHRDLWEFAAERDEDLPDGMMATQAIETLKQCATSSKPFFLGLGFFKPHLPFVAPRQDWEAMEDTEVSLPPSPAKYDSRYWHRSAEFYKYAARFEKSNPLAPQAQRESRRAYLACVRYVDRQVGRVVAALDDLGLRENTIVVVWGDHGWHLGDSALWGKHSLFERSLRSTLIVRAPGLVPAGLHCHALVESLDLYPTLVEWCAPRFTRTEHPLDGRSLATLLRGEVDQVRSASLSYWRSGQVGIRTLTHRLILTRGEEGPQHFDLQDLARSEDPQENLAAAQPELVQTMLRALDSNR